MKSLQPRASNKAPRLNHASPLALITPPVHQRYDTLAMLTQDHGTASVEISELCLLRKYTYICIGWTIFHEEFYISATRIWTAVHVLFTENLTVVTEPMLSSLVPREAGCHGPLPGTSRTCRDACRDR